MLTSERLSRQLATKLSVVRSAKIVSCLTALELMRLDWFGKTYEQRTRLRNSRTCSRGTVGD